jgi:hypothetical protein
MTRVRIDSALLVLLLTVLTVDASGQVVAPPFPPVSQLPEQFDLPDPLLGPAGVRLADPKQWPAQRERLKAMLTHYMYGVAPPAPDESQVNLHRTLQRKAFEGAAIEEQYTLTITRNGKSVNLRIGLFRPMGDGPYPTIIKNCRVLFDTGPNEDRYQSIVGYDVPAAREAVSRGYLLCKFRREDLAPDRKNNRAAGVFRLYPEYDWGSIRVWAWGQSVVLDALRGLGYADMNKIVVTGHSRGGQTAIAAGVFDERIDVVVPCTGGYGSVGTLRIRDPDGVRGTMDYIAYIKEHVPHWFGPGYYEFAGQQDRLPFDAHTLVALVAPRPLLNTNATEDQYNNTLSIEAGMRAGGFVYDWLNADDNIRLHWREGRHDQAEADWGALFDFADECFFGKPGATKYNRWIFPESRSTRRR